VHFKAFKAKSTGSKKAPKNALYKEKQVGPVRLELTTKGL